jgi:hypothetical protein
MKTKTCESVRKAHVKLRLRKTVSEEISTIKKKPSTLHGSNRKDALRAYQELAGPLPFQDKSHERVSSFERISLG